jgi:outer membrane receptor protein involved in Fe transport
MIDGAVANGEKPGGVNSGAFALSGDVTVRDPSLNFYEPETNITYELGWKGDLFDSRVRGDVSLFYTDWSDAQMLQRVEPFGGGTPRSITMNAGEIEAKGLEASFQMALTQEFTGVIGYAYSDSTFKSGSVSSFIDFDATPGGDVSGKDLPLSSKHQANISLTYRKSLREGMDWYARGDVNYKSEQYTNPTNNGTLPSRTLLNARIGLEADSWRVELWGDNLGNEDSPVSVLQDVYLNDGFARRTLPAFGRLRTYGITGTYHF